MKTIINMEQFRAANALADAEKIHCARGKEGDQLSGYHSLIITNGLLATLAYSVDKGGECQLIAQSLIGHLSNLQARKRFPGSPLPTDVMSAIRTISTTSEPTQLAMMSDECLTYLNYLKRFVRAMNKL